MALPNFICIGAQKAGTTTLFDLLKDHPDIFLPEMKEVHYFDYKIKRMPSDWYETEVFGNVKQEKAIGEISPHYIHHPDAPKRMYELNPDLKLIALIREPVGRAYSQYYMNVRLGVEKSKLPFEELLKLEAEGKRQTNYLLQGYYTRHFKRYFDYFPPEQILMILFEDFIGKRKAEIYRQVLQFLEVDEHPMPEQVHSNKASLPKAGFLRFVYSQNRLITSLRDGLNHLPGIKNGVKQMLTKKPPALSRELKQQLLETYYQHEIPEVERLLKRDLSHWYPFSDMLKQV